MSHHTNRTRRVSANPATMARRWLTSGESRLREWSSRLHLPRVIAAAGGGGSPIGRSRAARRRLAEAGMTTAEYAVGTLAACTFAALLIAVVRSPAVRSALAGIITSALGMGR